MLIDATVGGLVYPGQSSGHELKVPAFFDYSNPAGVEELCIRYGDSQHGFNVVQSIESILVTSGVKESLLLLALLLKEFGGRIWLPRLAWSGYLSIFEVLGYEILYYRHDHILVDIQGIKRGDSILINHPHNPTGFCLDDDLKPRLLDFSSQKGAMLIVDECLQHCTFRRSTRFSAAVSRYANLFIVDSLAKWGCLPGLRIGFVVANAVWSPFCVKLKNKIINPTSGISQFAALHSLDNATQWFNRQKRSLKHYKTETVKLLNFHGINVRGETAMYLWIEAPEKVMVEGKELRIGSYAVRVVPGSEFGAGQCFCRFSYVDSAANASDLLNLGHYIGEPHHG